MEQVLILDLVLGMMVQELVMEVRVYLLVESCATSNLPSVVTSRLVRENDPRADNLDVVSPLRAL
jgi:hypothetical protein